MAPRTKQGGSIMNNVVHFCKNRQCNNAWIDKDLTKAKSRPPQWKYCRECCERMGIDFDTQIPPRQQDKNLLQGGVNASRIDDKSSLGIILFRNKTEQQIGEKQYGIQNYR